jgi:hypothetical protein
MENEGKIFLRSKSETHPSDSFHQQDLSRKSVLIESRTVKIGMLREEVAREECAAMTRMNEDEKVTCSYPMKIFSLEVDF